MKLHGHPQKVEYADPSEFVDISCQSNWVHGENPRGVPAANPVLDLPGGTFGNGKLGHTHNDLLKYPLYGEVTGPFTCKFQIMLFQVDGEAFVNPQFQDGIRDIVWDATGSGVAPRMIGDPNGQVMFTGSLTVDPSLAQQFPTKHGWWTPAWTITTRYTNGDIVDQLLYGSVFVILDANAPVTAGSPIVSARISPFSAIHREEQFGNNQVETLRDHPIYLPVAPLTAPYSVGFATSGYGAVNLPAAITEVRADADIHHFVAGRVIGPFSATPHEMIKEKNHQFDYTFDPTILGPGKHKIIVGRRQVTLSNDELIVAQLVFNVVVPGVVPPPPAQVKVPTVVGLTQTAAASALIAVGLTLGMIMPQHSDTVPVGQVISQDPVAGTSVAPGFSVMVVLSTGAATPPPPPPPTEKWEAVPVVVKRLKGTNRYCLCVVGETLPFECVELMVGPDPEV